VGTELPSKWGTERAFRMGTQSPKAPPAKTASDHVDEIETAVYDELYGPPTMFPAQLLGDDEASGGLGGASHSWNSSRCQSCNGSGRCRQCGGSGKFGYHGGAATGSNCSFCRGSTVCQSCLGRV
jgi:hypothetical protein